MNKAKNKENHGYKNFLLAIFDAWLLFNQDIPQKIEKDKKDVEIKEERKRKLGPRTTIKEKFFTQTEISILTSLVSNARNSYLDLAKNLGFSRHTVKKRIEKMMDQKKFQFFLGVNYQKLNLDFLVLNLILVNLKALEEIFQALQDCPRVFSIAKDIIKNNLQILFGIERSGDNFPNQYVNIIEQLQLDERVKECIVISLNPELYPKFLPLMPKNLPKPAKIAPCGKNCKICDKFVNSKCKGCPAVEGYRGNIFKIIEK